MNALLLLLGVLLAVAHAGLLGGRKNIHMPPSEEILKAAGFASKKLDGNAVTVISGSEQVVAGILYVEI